jgi:hypothetical protein
VAARSDLRKILAAASGLSPADEAAYRHGLKVWWQTKGSWIVNTPQRRRIPTANEIVRQQREDAERARNAPAKATPTAPTTGTDVAIPDRRTSVERYLDEIAPASIVGRMLKFDGKAGAFVTPDDGEPIAEGTEFTALCDQCLIGWIRFGSEGEPPTRHMGLLHAGFIMPARATLGDVDPARWPVGLDKKPSDPWLHQMAMVLQHAETAALFTFVTTNKTGRRAVGALLRHYDRMLKTNPAEYPVVRLEASGFNHPDQRIGWVATPMFTVVGRRPRDSAARPDTSLAADLDDDLPDHLR